MDARVWGHNCSLCAFFPEAPAGGRWEGAGACVMGEWRGDASWPLLQQAGQAQVGQGGKLPLFPLVPSPG
jgi:hypothetical protein